MAKTTLVNGIQNIALSFSGGGFRAATYCLGCSSYLHRLPYDGGTMLHKVRFISSASGGSITALSVFSMLRAGKDFDSIYKHILDNISGDKLMKKVFEILETDSYWQARPDKKRNLINAFTIAYDEDLFNHATYASLFEQAEDSLKVIDEISVNATEFNNGQNFRFGTRGTIGNAYLSLNKTGIDIIKKIRLGDILACSSCFPGGFEPVIYPRNFTWKTDKDALTWQQLASLLNYKDHYSNQPADPSPREEMAGFMDGGIDDNQGIYAFIKADNRRKEYEYDVYLPCDVSSNYLEQPFAYPKPVDAKILKDNIPAWKRRFNCWKWQAIVAILLVAAAGALISCFTDWKELSLVLYGISAGATLLALTLYLVARSYLHKIKAIFNKTPVNDEKPGTWKVIWKKYKDNLLNLPLNQLLNMAEARASSVLMLANDVYLKKIRRVSYDYLYSRDKKDINIDYSGDLPETDEPAAAPAKATENQQSWQNNIGTTAIYLLSAKNDWMLQRELKKEPWDEKQKKVSIDGQEKLLIEVLQPGEALRKYVDTATAMETTLWFDDYHVNEKAKESLLIAGQATMCFNLLRIVHRIDSTHASWEPLKKQLLEDWLKFKATPEHLLI